MPSESLSPNRSLTSTTDEPYPIYMRVKKLILKKIHDGEWKPNHKIPSEMDFVKSLGCSRMTVNRALRELTQEGVLVRLQGVGSFIAEGQGHTALFEVNNIAEEILQRQHRHHAVVVSLEQIAANQEQSERMLCKLGDALFHSVLVHFENEIPVQLEDRLVNPVQVPDYLSQDFQSITPNQYLMAQAPLTEAEHIIEAVLATPNEAKLLKINKTEACLRVNRKTWSNKQLISSARLTYPGSRYCIAGRFES